MYCLLILGYLAMIPFSGDWYPWYPDLESANYTDIINWVKNGFSVRFPSGYDDRYNASWIFKTCRNDSSRWACALDRVWHWLFCSLISFWIWLSCNYPKTLCVPSLIRFLPQSITWHKHPKLDSCFLLEWSNFSWMCKLLRDPKSYVPEGCDSHCICIFYKYYQVSFW